MHDRRSETLLRREGGGERSFRMRRKDRRHLRRQLWGLPSSSFFLPIEICQERGKKEKTGDPHCDVTHRRCFSPAKKALRSRCDFVGIENGARPPQSNVARRRVTTYTRLTLDYFGTTRRNSLDIFDGDGFPRAQAPVNFADFLSRRGDSD